MSFNDKITKLICSELKALNSTIEEEENFNQELLLYSASIDEIVYAMDKYQIIFAYFPERYEFGNTMLLKGTYIRLDWDDERRYNTKDLLSFLRKDESFDPSKYNSYQEIFTLTLECLKEIDVGQNSNWESEFKKFLDSKNPW
jgi:hypothetical protein